MEHDVRIRSGLRSERTDLGHVDDDCSHTGHPYNRLVPILFIEQEHHIPLRVVECSHTLDVARDTHSRDQE